MTAARMTGGEALVRSLAAHGVRQVFGLPGVQLDHATDALYHARDEIAFICARNEQAVSYMADGYARSSGREGVSMVVPGPGMLNGLAGLATAYACSSPLLYLAGQIDSAAIGRGLGALHEIPDQSGVLRTLTKWSGLALRPEEIPGLVHRAFAELRSGRPRPVGLEIPPDVLAASAGTDIPEPAGHAPAVPDDALLERASAMLARASRPVIVAGGGVLAADGAGALRELADALRAPVVMSENGRGAISARHRLAFDALAFRWLREEADLVLAVGTRFVTASGQIPAGSARLILINADAADLGPPRAPDLAVHGDARLALRALAAGGRGARSEWSAAELASVRSWCEEQYADISPQRAYLAAIREALPDDGVLVSELTQIGYAANACFPVYAPRTYLTQGYQGTLGSGFATALGVKAANPGRAVVSVTGDGGFSWTLPELSTARKYRLATVTVVFNDGYFGNVRRIQRDRFGARYLASDLVNPAYGKLADAFGVAGARAEGPAELAAVLKQAIAAGEPVLIDAPVGEFPAPWHLLREGVARRPALLTRRLVARPDPHSFRDDTQPVVEHLSWDVRADFGTRTLDAAAELRLRSGGAGSRAAGPLDLDTRDLTIVSVTAGGADVAFELGPADPVMGSRLSIALPAAATAVRIRYRTSPRSTALQWCTPEQTADGTYPFLYSQCQTIHARSMLPIQDTPAVRFSYDATLRVPAGLTAVLSASLLPAAGDGPGEAGFRFVQRQAIPAYLLALAAGRLDGREIGPRSTVWAEPSQLAAAAWEFAEVEHILATAEKLFGPYAWGRADLLVLPPSYPYGGMENPQLIFLTPTLIAGDRSLVTVVAHEIAHAWTGNLVTAASLDHFWVNEGFTIFAEREITTRMTGRDLTELRAAVGRADLEADLRYLAGQPELTRLRLDLRGIDPDVASSHVALEKGYLFLRAMAESVGAERFLGFLRDYLAAFRFSSVTGEEVVAFARERLPGAVDYDEWLYGTGLPPGAPAVSSPLLDAVAAIGQAAPEPDAAAAWSADEWQVYLAGLRPPVPAGLLAELDRRFQLTASPNPEILRLWLTAALGSGYPAAVPAAVGLLGRVGRLKFLKPLYDALAQNPDTRVLARECFERNRGRYHPIAVTVISTRLSQAGA